MLLLLSGVIGWVVVKWPGWFYGPNGPYGPRKPQPQPWKIAEGLIGAAGGIGSAVLFRETIGDAGLLATMAVAGAGGFFLADLVESVTGLGTVRPEASAGSGGRFAA